MGVKNNPADTNYCTQSQLKACESRMSRWRKGKSAPNSPCLDRTYWTPLRENTWCDSAGRRVVLNPTSLLDLTDVERAALQKISLSRLQKSPLDVSVTVPKEWSKTKKNRFLLKRRIAGSASLHDNNSAVRDLPARSKSSKGTDRKCTGWVFGIPLGKCIANDAELQRLNPDQFLSRSTTGLAGSSYSNSNVISNHRKSYSLAGDGREYNDSAQDGLIENTRGVSQGGSMSGSRAGANRSHLVDALLLSLTTQLGSAPAERKNCKLSKRHLLVPYIVNSCCQYLQNNGCGVIGIFRIGCSKKRTVQLRDEFDSGRLVDLNTDHNPHDVAAILKEFFRDLPDPLLTRDLYSAFVATRKLNDLSERSQYLTLLLSLLPAANRDTLWTLLAFLHHIAGHSIDSTDQQGNIVQGNKMNSHNLATLFGPNILHKAKSGQGQFQVESFERAEEREEVISVVQEMIELHQQIFQLSAELYDEVLRTIFQTKPDMIDNLLRQITNDIRIDPEPESCCSIYDDSDSSSIPNSPSYLTESNPAHPRTLIEALQPPRTLIEALQPPMFFPPRSWSPPPATRHTFRSPPSGRRQEEDRSISDLLKVHASSGPVVVAASAALTGRPPRGGALDEYDKYLALSYNNKLPPSVPTSPRLSPPAALNHNPSQASSLSLTQSPKQSPSVKTKALSILYTSNNGRNPSTRTSVNNSSYTSPQLSGSRLTKPEALSMSSTPVTKSPRTDLSSALAVQQTSPKSILAKRPSAPKQQLLIQITSDEYSEENVTPRTQYSDVDALITNPPFRLSPRRSRRSYGVPHGCRVVNPAVGETSSSPRSVSTPRSKQLPTLLTVPYSKHLDGPEGMGCGSLSSLSSRSSRSFSPSPSPDSLSPARKAATTTTSSKMGKINESESSSSSRLRPLGITSSLQNSTSNGAEVTSWWLGKWDRQADDLTRLKV